MSRMLAQPLRFLLVGAAGYLVTVGAFAAAFGTGVPYAGAAVLAYLVANALMYVGNRYFTFRLGNGGFWRAYARYLLVGLLVAALSAGALGLLVEVGGLAPRPGQVLALLLVTPPAFVMFKRWTFRLRAT
jgi:putative flippase GtrA